MNVQQRPTEMTESRELHSAGDTGLHGRWLMLARFVWFILVALALVVFVASLPVYISQLQSVCYDAECASGQLTPQTLVALRNLGFTIGFYTSIRSALTIISVLVWFGVAGVLVWRKSNDWMALLVALMMVLLGTDVTLNTVAGSHSVWQFPSQLLSFLAYFLLVLVILLFPNGRFVPRWTWGLMIVIIPVGGQYNFFPNLTSYTATWFILLDGLVWIGFVISVMVTQVYRYVNVSSLRQRQQTKWVVFAITIILVVEIGFSMPTLFLPSLNQPGSLYLLVYNTITSIFLLFIPLSMGIAILRYRLWDIDIIINRALVYGTLTALLALIYIGLVIGLQFLLRGIINQNSDVAIVASTLAIAALFQPLRKGIQNVIDRRFYRRKYDAAKTLAAFSATLRNEVDLNQLSEHLLAVVQETMQPAHVSLWLRPSEKEAKRKTEA